MIGPERRDEPRTEPERARSAQPAQLTPLPIEANDVTEASEPVETSDPAEEVSRSGGPPHGADDAEHRDGVAIRTLVVRGLPLLVAGVGDLGRGPQLRAALEERGLVALSSFIGVELPRGAQVGFMLGTTELRLVDDRDDTLLRAERAGLDEHWLAAARRLKGTMTVVVRGASPSPESTASELAAVIDERARQGDAWGAIVGFGEDRMSLPLLF
jgi:hypothetical protein